MLYNQFISLVSTQSLRKSVMLSGVVMKVEEMRFGLEGCIVFFLNIHTIYRIAGNFRQGKSSPKPGPMYCRKKKKGLFSRSLDWAKLNSNIIYI